MFCTCIEVLHWKQCYSFRRMTIPAELTTISDAAVFFLPKDTFIFFKNVHIRKILSFSKENFNRFEHDRIATLCGVVALWTLMRQEINGHLWSRSWQEGRCVLRPTAVLRHTDGECHFCDGEHTRLAWSRRGTLHANFEHVGSLVIMRPVFLFSFPIHSPLPLFQSVLIHDL